MIVNSIMSVFALIIMAFVSIIAFVYLVACLGPQITLKPKLSKKVVVHDRGIKKMSFDDGRSIVYEPELKIREYIQQYTLIDKSGGKFIKCMIDDNITRIHYEIIAFNNQNKMIDSICVSEYITKRGYTSTVVLPTDTSYITLVLRKVEGGGKKYVNKERFVRYSTISLACYAVFTMIATVIETLSLKGILEAIFKTFNLRLIAVKSAFYILFSSALGLACAALIILHYILKSTKVINK